MNAKKVILIILLAFSILSLVLIVVFAKNKWGIFNKFYDNYVKAETIRAGETVKKNMDQILLEVKNVAEDGLVRSIFLSAAVGENTDRYIPDFNKIKTGISGCAKLQIINYEGLVIFSTMIDEIYLQKLKTGIYEKIRAHFESTQDMFVYFIDTNQFVAIYPYKTIAKTGGRQEGADGYVSIYYNTRRLIEGNPNTSVQIPFSQDNFVFFSANNVAREDISKMIGFCRNNRVRESKGKFTIGGLAEVYGINVIYYSHNEKYIPYQIIIFLLVNFLLLGLVMFVLAKMLKDEKLVRGNYTFNGVERVIKSTEETMAAPAETNAFKTPSDEEIGTLVEDIEKDKVYEEGFANRGIEEMIMANNMDLTAMPEGEGHVDAGTETVPGVSQEIAPEIDDKSFAIAEDGSEQIAIPDLAIDETTHDDIGIKKEEFEPLDTDHEYVVISDSKFEKDKEAVSIEASTAPGADKDREATELFAEQDRILSGVSADLDEGIKTETPEGPVLSDVEEEGFTLGAEPVILEEAPSIDVADFQPQPEDKKELNIQASPIEEIKLEESPGLEPIGGAPDKQAISGPGDDIAKEITVEELPVESAMHADTEVVDTAVADTEVADTAVLDFNNDLKIDEIESEIIQIDGRELEEISSQVDKEPGQEFSLEEHVKMDGLDKTAAVEIEPSTVETVPVRDEAVVFDTSKEAVPSDSSGIDFRKVFTEPPVKINALTKVEEYVNSVAKLARDNMNYASIFIFRRDGNHFNSLNMDGVTPVNTALDVSDPVYRNVLAKQKSLSVTGDLAGTRYLNEKFSRKILDNLDEMFIVPIVKNDIIEGIAMYGRNKGTPDVKSVEKYELYNLGFLQNA